MRAKALFELGRKHGTRRGGDLLSTSGLLAQRDGASGEAVDIEVLQPMASQDTRVGAAHLDTIAILRSSGLDGDRNLVAFMSGNERMTSPVWDLLNSIAVCR